MNAPEKIAPLGDADWRARFWAKVDKSAGEDACWPWAGARKETGYGKAYVGQHKYRRAHRLAFQLSTGIAPGDLCVLHRCDNPPCCNPKHLRLGTQDENIADRVRKGRSRGLVGEANHQTPLTTAQVIDMRERYDPGVRGSIAAAAREYGLSKTGAKDILRRRTWRHI